MPASSSLSVPSKAEYLSKRYGNSHDDSDRKEKKRRKKAEKTSKKKKKKSKRNEDERSSGSDDDDEDSLLGGSRAYRRDGDSDAESDEDGPLVVDEADHLDDVSNGDKEKGRGQRYDSEDDDDDAGAAPRRAPARTQKRRYDSDDASKGSPSPPRSSGEVAASSSGRDRNQPRRYDSDDDESDDGPRAVVPIKHEQGGGRKRRYDSDDVDDDDSDGSDSAKRKTSSGHRTGLQSGRTFGSAEKRLHKSKRDEAQKTVDTHGIGETVYRDKASGRREEASGAASSAASAAPSSSILTEEEQAALLNVGRVQREAVEERHRRMGHMAASTFARHQDDDGLEEMRKSAIREGDPMAAYASAQGSSSKRKTNGGAAEMQNVRPVYKGPPPKPNRYGIRPGFRWDGVDRGNGFEDRLLARRYNQQHQKELAYRMSSADM
jgi:pre-mRNA-splicing factor CWC26